MSTKSRSLQRGKVRNQGYSLIELLVVTTIVVLLLLTVSSMFMTFMLGNAQTNIRRQLKGEGNAIIGQLEFLFRNTNKITDNNSPTFTNWDCTNSSGTSLTVDSEGLRLVDVDNNEFVIRYSGNILSVNNNTLNSTYVIPTAPQIVCYGSTANSKKSIKVDFTLQYTNETSFTENFNTLTQIRNL